MKFKVVKTPKKLEFTNQSSLRDIGSTLNGEFKESECWTDNCSKILSSNLFALFRYDRFEFVLGRAYGDSRYKIGLNPMMIVCYHPSCIRKKWPIVKLWQMYDIRYYVMHLIDHNDKVGNAMRLRFSAVLEDNFASTEHLDQISPSPYSMNPTVSIPLETVPTLEGYGISRQLPVNYTCFWKSKLIESELINPPSLTFQEDDALIHSCFHFPQPVKNWNTWNTLSFYGLKLYASLSASALSLYRGVTRNRLRGNTTDLSSYISSINHPGPSLSTIQQIFPTLNYESEVFHQTEVMFHLKFLSK